MAYVLGHGMHSPCQIIYLGKAWSNRKPLSAYPILDYVLSLQSRDLDSLHRRYVCYRPGWKLRSFLE